MAKTRLRLWRVHLRAGYSANVHYINTKSDNLVVLAKEIEKLVSNLQKDYTTKLRFESVDLMGIVGE